MKSARRKEQMKNVWTTASGFPANVAYIHTPDPTGNVIPSLTKGVGSFETFFF